MSVIVDTSVLAFVAQKNLTEATNSLGSSNEAELQESNKGVTTDDVAGTYVTKDLKSELSSFEQCQTNISTGLNMLSVAENDLTVIQNNILEIKELAIQAVKNTCSSEATAVETKISSYVDEINEVAKNSNFNGMELFSSAVGSLGQTGLVINASANETNPNVITVDKSVFASATNTDLGLILNDVSNINNANSFLSDCQTALSNILARKTSIGVAQSLLGLAADGLATTIENISASNVTIMDANIASEVTESTKNQILQQVSTSIYTQANQAPGTVMSLFS